MPCVNHPDAVVQSYCQNCGKALCANCVRTTPSGQVFCEPCFATVAAGPGAVPGSMPGAIPGQPYWQAPPQGFAVPPPGMPNPAAAAVLGIIPGVGAMYNGQLFKGLIHVVIFAVLISLTDYSGIFGLFIAGWVFYQSFEAFHTAKARRDGLPLPDPFGLNELGNWLSHSFRGTPPPAAPGQPGVPVDPATGQAPSVQPGAAPGNWGVPPGGYASGNPPIDPAGYQANYPNYPNNPGYVPPSAPYAEPYTGQYPGPDPNYPGAYPPGYIPPVPPVGPFGWRRKEPVWAIVLIGLGVILLLKRASFFAPFVHFTWPILLIGLGVFFIIRRVGDNQGGSK